MMPAPTRKRGFTIMAVGVGYALATLGAGAWLSSGWVAWGVVISGLGAGVMLIGLGAYIVRTADQAPS